MTTAEVGMNRFMIPLALWYAVTTSSAGTFANEASGAMIGIATVARPDDDGIRNDRGRKSTYRRLTNTPPPSPETACSAALRTGSLIGPWDFVAVPPRALTMLGATPSRSRAPLT